MMASAASPLLDRLLPNRLLAGVSLAMAAAVVIAVARGAADWPRVPALIWVHLAVMQAVLLLTPAILLGRKGSPRHRLLGKIWAGLMLFTAVETLFFNAGDRGLGVFSGQVSPIHALSLFVGVMVPRLVWLARRHRVRDHERTVRGLVIGALLVAGWFTFAFDRMLGRWLFG